MRRIRGYRLPFALTLILAGSLPACSPNARSAEGTLEVERQFVGDTLVVHIRTGSVWDAPAALVEELRIGMLDGPDEYLFGAIQGVAPDGDGGVYVFDGQAPALRHYGADGRYLRTLGGRGAGPGEYLDAGLGAAVMRDGRVLLRDPRNMRINVYSPDGDALDHWHVPSGLFTSRALALDTADNVYLKTLLEPPQQNRPWRIGLIRMNDRGEIIDTLPDPRVAGEPQESGWYFAPAKVWDWSPFGYYVVGVNDRYVFELHDAGQPVRVVVDHEPVRLHPDERAEWEAQAAWTRTNRAQFLAGEIPRVPAVKPAYQNLYVGLDGRIWVRRYTAASRSTAGTAEPRPDQPPPITWHGPAIYDVFEPDGSYLGEVQLPPRTTVWVFDRARLWAVQRGDLDEQYVVAYRIEPSTRTAQ